MGFEGKDLEEMVKAYEDLRKTSVSSNEEILDLQNEVIDVQNEIHDIIKDNIKEEYDKWKEAEEKKDTSTKILYKKGDYYKFRTYGNCTNISKKPDVAGGWINNYDLHRAEEW